MKIIGFSLMSFFFFIYQWTVSSSMIEKRHKALQTELQYIQTSLSEPFEIYNVDIGNQQYIHTLKVEPNQTRPQNITFVLLHGFTGALGHWKHLIPYLTQEGYRVYAIDLLGWGLSSRPSNFSNWEMLSTTSRNVNDVTDFWVDSIEEWRQKEGLSNIHIVGHSQGGWVAGEYALKYPQHISELTLANSVGVYLNDPSWFNGDAGWFMETTRSIWGINWPFRLLRFIDGVFPSILGNSTTTEYIRAYNQLPASGEIVSEYIRRRQDPDDDHTLWNRLSQYKHPVHLIYSESDYTVPLYNSSILEQFDPSIPIDVSILGMNTTHTPTTPEQFETISNILINQKKTYMDTYPDRIQYSNI